MEKWENNVELLKSKTDLEDIPGKAIEFVAYPYGSFNEDTIGSAQESGYWGGLTTRIGYTNCAERVAMNRIPVFRASYGLDVLLA
jgi:peptidoglycan/xylan/chitin deacetylase (PgdA/CDA1 family)